MQTAKKTFSDFIIENKEILLQLATVEGFRFSVKESSRCVTVRCTLPNDGIRFIIFDDHRIDNPHGSKPHICNQWHKTVGDPISYTLGTDVVDKLKLHNTLLATAVMCLTQCDGYNVMKAEIFL